MTTLPLSHDMSWLQEKLDEAMTICDEIRTEHRTGRLVLPDWLEALVEDFHSETFLNGCTTLGPDCACNTSCADATASTRNAGPDG